MVIRIKRIIAFLIDWNITLLPILLLYELSLSMGIENEKLLPLTMLFSFILVFGGFTLVVLRDFIFNGKSLGKRIFGLIILDKNTMGIPKKRQLILKNIFLFIYPVECILLLATGETLGNKITDTVVIPKNQKDHTNA